MAMMLNEYYRGNMTKEKYLFSCSLSHLADQLRRMDQKITTEVDNEIVHAFQLQQQAIESCQKNIHSLKSRAK